MGSSLLGEIKTGDEQMCENLGAPESRIYHPPELITESWYHLVETTGLDEDVKVKPYGPFASRQSALAHQEETRARTIKTS